MRVLITAKEPQSAAEAAALLRHRYPHWDVRVCHGAEVGDDLSSAERWDICLWDVGAYRDRQDAFVRGSGLPVCIAWCAPEDVSFLPAVLEAGAPFHLVRCAGWQEFFPQVIAQALRSAQKRAYSLDEQASLDALRHIQECLLDSTHEPTVLTNNAGLIVQFNRAAEQFTGYHASSVIGGPLASFFEPPQAIETLFSTLVHGELGEQATQIAGLQDVRVDANGVTFRSFMRNRDGHYHACGFTCRPVVTASGRRSGYVLVVHPSQATASAPPREEFFAARLLADAADVSPIPLVVVDAQGVILRPNKAFLEMVELPGPTQLVGRRLHELLSDPHALTIGIEVVCREGETQLLDNALVVNGERRVPCRGTATAIKDANGELSAVAISFIPVSASLSGQPEAFSDLVVGSLRLLEDTIGDIRETEDLQTLIEHALAAASRLGDFDSAIAVTRDQESGDLEMVSAGLEDGDARGIVDAAMADLSDPNRPRGVTPHLMVPVRDITGTEQRERLRSALLAAGVETVYWVALVLNDQVSGALLLCAPTQQATCGENEQILLSALGSEIGLAFSRLLLLRSAERAEEFQAKLLDVSLALNAGNDVEEILQLVARTALDIAQGHECCLQILDEKRQQFEKRYSAPELADADTGNGSLWSGTIAWEAVQRGETVVVSPSAGGTGGAIIAVPMTLDFNPIGVLMLARQRGVGFRAHEVSGLKLLAAQAAVAIHNTNLYEIARRRSQHMEVVAAQAWQEEARARALFEVATAVTEKTDLQEILADVTRSACTEIGFERAQIYLADHEHRTLVGQLEALTNSSPTPLEDRVVPLTRQGGDRLAEAALGTAPYMIDAVEEATAQGLRQYERLLVPLVAQGLLVGLIVADNPLSGNPVSPQRTRLLHSLAGLASVAIERARVEKLRGMLISSVSHELRAPLASIRAYNELVLDGDAGEINEEQKLYLSRVDRACGRLERVIEDLMNLSKLRTGEVAISKTPTDLSNLVRAVLDTMEPKASAAGVTLEVSEAPNVPLTMTDQGRLEQVLTNLVDNAIKFQDKHGWVRVSLQTDGSGALITVADNGPGIPKSYQSVIFEEFQHGTDDRTRAKEGAGLGLAIASRVVGVLGGKLYVESEEGQGSVFSVSLPLEPIVSQPTSDAVDQPDEEAQVESGEAHERSENFDH